MAKSLFLVRHAKSDWSIPGQKDFDRDLNNRGLADAPKMGRRLTEMGVKPDIIMCSPAKRAILTIELITEQLNFEFDRIVFDQELYEASVRNLLGFVNKIEDKFQSAMIVGHNPTLTYITEYLTKYNIGNIPTCGIVELHFEVDSWKEISEGTGTLKWFIYPKENLE